MDLKVTSQPASENHGTSGREDRETADEHALKGVHSERPFHYQRVFLSFLLGVERKLYCVQINIKGEKSSF